MPYLRHTWADGSVGGTPIDADTLNEMEVGIEDASLIDISSLTAAGTLTPADLSPVSQSGTTNKATMAHVWGRITATGGVISSDVANGGWAQGYAGGAGSTVSSSGDGGFAQGWAGYGGDIISTGFGSFAQGECYGGAITASNNGAFAQGYTYSGSITASDRASFARGHTYGAGAAITASGRAAHVMGYAKTSGVISAGGRGSSARGYVVGVGSKLYSGAHGSTAIGYAGGGSHIYANGYGSFAAGRGYGNDIIAGYTGAFAHGSANTADIVASAENAVQFGPGTNAIANSFRVGTGLRLHGIGGVTPGTIANGDFWLDSVGFVQVRSNSSTVRIGRDQVSV